MLKNDRPYRKYSYFSACTFYLGAIIVTLVAQALAGFVSAALAGKYPDIAKNGDFNTAFMIVIQLLYLAVMIGYSKLNGYKLNFTVFSDSRTGKKLDALCVVIPALCAVILMAGMYLPTIWYGYFTRYALHIPPDYGEIDLTSASSVVMVVIASVFLAPVCEEAIYRGVLFNGLKTEKSTLKAVMLSAVAFLFMHMSPVQVVFQFSLGVLSAFIAHRTNRLAPSVVLHATANALALVMQLTPFAAVLEGCVAWLTSHVAAAVFITLGAFAVAGALLFVLVRFVLGRGHGTETTEPMQHCEDGGTSAKDEALAAIEKKNGSIRYYIALGICILMFVINLTVAVL